MQRRSRAEEPSSADLEREFGAQIARYPRLSPEEERDLLDTSGAGREAANRKLIEHNLYLVYEAAFARRESGVPFGDLFQEGSVALISAVEHYVGPPSGLTDAISSALATTLDHVVARTQEAQRNDEAFVAACRLLDAAERLLAGRLNRAATEAEMAELLHWERPRVRAIREMLEKARGIHDEELLAYLDDVEDERDDDH